MSITEERRHSSGGAAATREGARNIRNLKTLEVTT